MWQSSFAKIKVLDINCKMSTFIALLVCPGENLDKKKTCIGINLESNYTQKGNNPYSDHTRSQP